MTKRKGLLLDRRDSVRNAIETELPDWQFHVASTIEAAYREIKLREPLVGLIVFDDNKGWPAGPLEALLAVNEVEWIAIVNPDAFSTQAIRPIMLRSFHDFHTLPLDRNRLLVTLGHAHGKASICKSLARCDEQLGTGRYGMTGCEPKMLELYRQIDKVVSVDAPVLIGGESGTGKELVAKAIHLHSDRAEGPFVAMNCGAIPASLIQSELFGHERGAFTGAQQRKIGNIEAAADGVLFLDEIGDLPLDLQANLLRFLQEKTIVRLGSTERIPVNARVIAATHVDLLRAVNEGHFREDLYYRLNVLILNVPALRERIGDIARLANTIFDNCAKYQRSPQVKGFSIEAIQAMHEYRWPGNVRELINRVQHALIMTENKLISAADLGLSTPVANSPTLEEIRASAEKKIIVSSLQKYQYNVSEVARRLGVSRVTLYRMIDRLGIML